MPRAARVPGSKDVLAELLRQGAEKLLGQAIEAEVEEWLDQRSPCRDDLGRRQIVRNGFMPERVVMTSQGEVAVRQPRVRDRRPAEHREKFCSAFLPTYLRTTKSAEEPFPWFYVKGITTGDFAEALAALLGADVQRLPSSTVVRLKAIWQQEHLTWTKRSLADKRYPQIWADGIHLKTCAEKNSHCILLLMGAKGDGVQEFIAVGEGSLESESSWRTLLLDCQGRGLVTGPEIAFAHGALGFWKALPKVWPRTRAEPCWIHKTAHVPGNMEKRSSTRFASGFHKPRKVCW
jgi:transposase-like protein